MTKNDLNDLSWIKSIQSNLTNSKAILTARPSLTGNTKEKVFSVSIFLVAYFFPFEAVC